jgi:hypothetical protein
MNLAGWVQPPHRSEVATIVPAGAEKERNAGSRVEESPRHATSSLFVAATGDLQSSLLVSALTMSVPALHVALVHGVVSIPRTLGS